ncbi:hypothetical protein [Nocardioides sp. Root140]|uniref:hypothetical protein n=1 Tax=Nocardioides sp. Root140 TaxID=1736460 RepID=UPI000B1ABD2E|nr:hypothetical protein [Nocardioides sp. Root140]
MSEPRAKDRRAAVLVRMSEEQKALLVEEAAMEGISLQVLMERRLLGNADATNRNPGRIPKDRNQTELFKMTG